MSRHMYAVILALALTLLFKKGVEFFNATRETEEKFAYSSDIWVIDPRAAEYEQEFWRLQEKYWGVNYRDKHRVSIVFTNLVDNPKLLGHCIISHRRIDGLITRRHIEINIEKWDKLSSEQKLALILHELGHCSILRDHVDDIIEINGARVNKSLMSSTAIDSHTISLHYDRLTAELFSDPDRCRQDDCMIFR